MARNKPQPADTELDIYARVSRLGDERQRSTEGQVEDCVVRVEEYGATVGEVHVDQGRSAWNPRVKRKRWTALMERLESGATGGVVVFDMARFSRRPIEGERLIEAANRGLIVLDSEHEYDLTTADGKAQFRDQMKMAAYESDRTSTKSKRGKRLKAMKGEVSSSTRPFGFEPDAVTRRESESGEIFAAARRVLDGENQDRIVTDWNARGIRTSTGRTWTRETFRQMLLRPRNNGQIVHNGVTVGRFPGEPIFDDETWADLTTLFASRRRGRPNSDVYLCSGRVYCGLCGHTLTGRPRKYLKPYPDGAVKRQYWCHPRGLRQDGCGRVTIDQRQLDRHMEALVPRILADPRHAAAVEAATKAAGEKRQKLEDAIERAEELAEELASRLGREEITLSRFDRAIAPLDKKLARLRAELDALDVLPEEDADPERVAASLTEWRRRWKAADTSERRQLMQRAFRGRRVVVMPAERAAAPGFDSGRIVIVDPSEAG